MSQRRRGQAVPREERLGIIRLSPTKKSIIIVLDKGPNGYVTRRSLDAVIAKQKPYGYSAIQERTKMKRHDKALPSKSNLKASSSGL